MARSCAVGLCETGRWKMSNKKHSIKRICEETDRIFKVNLKSENPYEENTPAWHCYIDVSCSMNIQTVKGTVSLAVMMSEHSQPIEYYETYLSQLIKDQILVETEGVNQ